MAGAATGAGLGAAGSGCLVTAAPEAWASAGIETALQAKQIAKIRAFSTFFRAPTNPIRLLHENGTAGEFCKYVARGKSLASEYVTYSMTAT